MFQAVRFAKIDRQTGSVKHFKRTLKTNHQLCATNRTECNEHRFEIFHRVERPLLGKKKVTRREQARFAVSDLFLFVVSNWSN